MRKIQKSINLFQCTSRITRKNVNDGGGWFGVVSTDDDVGLIVEAVMPY